MRSEPQAPGSIQEGGTPAAAGGYKRQAGGTASRRSGPRNLFGTEAGGPSSHSAAAVGSQSCAYLDDPLPIFPNEEHILQAGKEAGTGCFCVKPSLAFGIKPPPARDRLLAALSIDSMP